MLNIYEIFEAWSISFKPTELQKKIALDRFNVCNSCEFKREILKSRRWSLVCGECGCPISKKIYSQVPNACPKKYWKDVDTKNGIIKVIKREDSLI